MLEKHGLEGATVPRIAKQAGLSPGAVYRRFPDKDALMRAVLLRFYDRIQKKSDESLRLEMWKDTTVRQKAYIVIQSAIRSHERFGKLLSALFQFGQQHPDAFFRRRSAKLELGNFQQIVKLLLQHREEIGHPDPDLAVAFASMMVAFAMREVFLVPAGKRGWSDILPGPISKLDVELPRLFLRYLGVKDADAPPPEHPAICKTPSRRN